MPLILGAQSAVSAGDVVTNSCCFNKADSAYMYKTPGSTGDRKTWTFSAWIKRGAMGATETLIGHYTDADNRLDIGFMATNTFYIYEREGGSTRWDFQTTQLFRDPSAWYHFVVAMDTTQSVEANRMKFYVNGTQVTVWTDESYPALNLDTQMNESGTDITIGGRSSNYFDGYMAEVVLLDGTAAAPTSFGEFDSDSPTIWKPISVSGLTFGTNGFYLDFEDSANLGNDANGGTDLTESGLVAADQATDTPANNFCTFNSAATNPSDTGSLSNGNTTYSVSNYSYNARGTLAMPAGKWYWEGQQSAKDTRFGVTTANSNPNLDTDSTDFYWGSTGYGGVHVLASSVNADWAMSNNDTSRSYTTYSTGIGTVADDIIMVAMDVDNGKMYMGVNGVWFNSGDPVAGTNPVQTITNGSPDPFCIIGSMATSSGRVLKMNFGGCSGFDVSSANQDDNGYGNFEYDVPAGYLALCTKNLGSDGG